MVELGEWDENMLSQANLAQDTYMSDCPNLNPSSVPTSVSC